MEPAEQMRIGDHAQPATDPTFVTDDHLAALLVDVEAVLRGACSKIAAVRRHLQGPAATPEPDTGRMRQALEYLADIDSWLGDPHDQRSVLFGDATPFELAAEALGRA